MSMEDDPTECCLRCNGAGCEFCGGEGEVPFGTFSHDDDDPVPPLPQAGGR